MNLHGRPIGPTPTDEMAVTTSFRGRIYTLCSEGQYAYVIQSYRMKLAQDAHEAGKKLTQAELESRLAKWLAEECPFATHEMLLSKMTPDELEHWRNSYRFAGIHRRS